MAQEFERPAVGYVPVPHTPRVFGRAEYKFEEAPTLTNLPPRDQLTKEAKDIIEAYEQVLLQRSAIRQSLDNFVTKVGRRPESAELTACFEALRQAAGVDAEIHLKSDPVEPLNIQFDDATWQNLHDHHRSAQTYLRSALSNSFAFLQTKERILVDIEDKLRILSNHRWSQNEYEVYQMLRNVPKWIKSYANEVERFLNDVKKGECDFKGSPM